MSGLNGEPQSVVDEIRRLEREYGRAQKAAWDAVWHCRVQIATLDRYGHNTEEAIERLNDIARRLPSLEEALEALEEA